MRVYVERACVTAEDLIVVPDREFVNFLRRKKISH